MSVEVLGIDHVYFSVSDLDVSEKFYDQLMEILGFRKVKGLLHDEMHVHYVNKQYGFTLRPAKNSVKHDPYSPGLHHFCFRVEDEAAVNEVAEALSKVGITFSGGQYYPVYAEDYYAIFLEDPDGIRLEVTNFRKERKELMERT